MSNKTDKARDPFSFSLRGMTTIASFVAPTAIAINRMNHARDAQADEVESNPPDTALTPPTSKQLFGRFWLRAARRAS